ncbi:MAG: N-acetylmuramoyl-L-alanine amidase [Candidatus Omnitrophica bacterium]|nr:N-acetylmuramoyl-L-alanine amidase [Candidatus Omnitrophota bacterium]
MAPGETLWRIGKMYDVDIETIKKANRIRNVRKVEIGDKLYIPGASPRKDVVTLYPSRKWKYIIIHHSATDAGNSMQFNASHIQRGWKGVGYHFIIDNGTLGKDDGQIEMGPRWIKQQNGAHCKAGDMNEKGIGVCLVGNFSKDRPTRKQMQSLKYLVNKLRNYYKIPKNRIMGHGDVKGAKTECPGKRFSVKRFRATL